MAYVREQGNQLAIVHGYRVPKENTVQQKVLFKFHSQAEVLQATGKGKTDESRYFKHLLSEKYPQIKFDWKKIDAALLDGMNSLPDIAEYRQQRLMNDITRAFDKFVFELGRLDPMHNFQVRSMLNEMCYDFLFLQNLIDHKMGYPLSKESPYNKDNQFFWRHSLQGKNLPEDTVCIAENHFNNGEYELAEKFFLILTRVYPDYAEGFNYLGLIQFNQNQFEEAIHFFEKAAEVGKTLFPSKFPKNEYWNHLETRPYMRGLRNSALAALRLQDFEKAETAIEILDKECGDWYPVCQGRAIIALNRGNWELAELAALEISTLDDLFHLIAAFAQFEQNKIQKAFKHFIHAALKNPVGFHGIQQKKLRLSKSSRLSLNYKQYVEKADEISTYIKNRSKQADFFIAQIMAHKRFKELIKLALKVQKAYNDDLPNMSKCDRELHRKFNDISFAAELVIDFNIPPF